MLDLVPISLTGYNKIMEEIKQLEAESVEVRKRVMEAREMGDLKENGEYIYGRQQLGFIEGRLGELRGKINTSEKVDCTKVATERAVFGTVVTLLNVKTGQNVTWQLLGPNDADIDNGSISIHSPVGDAIFMLSRGEKAQVSTPAGEFEYQVVDIAKSDIQ